MKYAELPTVYEAVATLLVIPTTTASCKRSFSSLRHLKTYICSNKGQEKLNSLILAASHIDKLNVIDKILVAEEFIAKSTHCNQIYDTFS